jgi:predicted lipid-binding transport protein (Tim44 family)
MDLDELGVGVERAGPGRAAGGGAGAGHRHRAAAEDQPAPADRHDHRVGGKRPNLHRHEVLANRSPATAVVVEYGAQKVPSLVHCDQPGGVPAADLFVEGVEQLLPRRGAGERRSLEERPAEPALIAEAFGGAVERHAEPVHQVDDPRTPVGHFLYRRLMLQKIAAVDRIVEML